MLKNVVCLGPLIGGGGARAQVERSESKGRRRTVERRQVRGLGDSKSLHMGRRAENARHLPPQNLAALVPHLIDHHHRPAHGREACGVLVKRIVRESRKESLLSRPHIVPFRRQLDAEMVRHLLYVVERLARIRVANVIEFIERPDHETYGHGRSVRLVIFLIMGAVLFVHVVRALLHIGDRPLCPPKFDRILWIRHPTQTK